VTVNRKRNLDDRDDLPADSQSTKRVATHENEDNGDVERDELELDVGGDLGTAMGGLNEAELEEDSASALLGVIDVSGTDETALGRVFTRINNRICRVARILIVNQMPAAANHGCRNLEPVHDPDMNRFSVAAIASLKMNLKVVRELMAFIPTCFKSPQDRLSA
jgi:hypothetical protein